VKIRSADFYAPDFSESELRYREDSFVNDSIRMAHQTIRPAKTPHYEPFDDPNLKYFFQSPVVLDVVRKTLNINLDARPSNPNRRSRRVRRKNISFRKKKFDIFMIYRRIILTFIME
jgi:hypothetical protein